MSLQLPAVRCNEAPHILDRWVCFLNNPHSLGLLNNQHTVISVSSNFEDNWCKTKAEVKQLLTLALTF